MSGVEEQLRRALGLELAIVAAAKRDQDRTESAAQAAAEYFDGLVDRSVTIACGWGRTLRAIGRHLRPRPTASVTLYDIIGQTRWWAPDDTPFELSTALAEAYGGTARHIPAPGFPGSVGQTQAYLANPGVAAVLAGAAGADAVIVSPGTADPETSSLILGGGMTSAEMVAIRDAGAIGDIVGQFYDAYGRPVPCGLDDRTVRLSLEQMWAARLIAVAVGTSKLAA